jgi:hypothetical protein
MSSGYIDSLHSQTSHKEHDATQEGRICSPAKTTNPKDRRCVTCGSPEGHGDWSKTEDGYVCSLCVTEARRANLKRAKDFDDYLRIVETATAKKVLFDPNFKPPDLRPKITVVVIPRDEKSRINALRRARGRAQ